MDAIKYHIFTNLKLTDNKIVIISFDIYSSVILRLAGFPHIDLRVLYCTCNYMPDDVVTLLIPFLVPSTINPLDNKPGPTV